MFLILTKAPLELIIWHCPPGLRAPWAPTKDAGDGPLIPGINALIVLDGRGEYVYGYFWDSGNISYIYILYTYLYIYIYIPHNDCSQILTVFGIVGKWGTLGGKPLDFASVPVDIICYTLYPLWGIYRPMGIEIDTSATFTTPVSELLSAVRGCGELPHIRQSLDLSSWF